jgi:hypothetical protein
MRFTVIFRETLAGSSGRPPFPDLEARHREVGGILSPWMQLLRLVAMRTASARARNDI